MDTRDQELEIQEEILAVTSTEPVAEAAASDIAEAIPGMVVARKLKLSRGLAALVSGGIPAADPGSAEFAEEVSSEAIADEEILDEIEDEKSISLHKNGHLESVIECMLFVSNEPLSSKQLAESLDLDEVAVEDAVVELEERLNGGSGLQLMRVAGGYQLCTRPEYGDYCAAILQPGKRKLSKAALETLAVVAYRQPCTMPEIEAVRGVSVSGVIKTLLERGVVKEAGHKHAPGRPMLYVTTAEFLEYFGLNDLSELPEIDMLAVEKVKALEAQRELIISESENVVESEDEVAEPSDME